MNAAQVAKKLRPLTWGVAVVALIAVGVWQSGLWKPSDTNPASDTAQAVGSADVGLTIYPPRERTEVPGLAGRTLDGTPFNLADLAGNVVVINVWGSWCGPCRAETSDLVRVARESAHRGVRFVGIDTRDNLVAAKAFVAKYKVPYPSVFDDDGQALLPFSNVVPSAAVPSTIVIDRDGNVAARVIGAVTYTTMSRLIDDLARSTP